MGEGRRIDGSSKLRGPLVRSPAGAAALKLPCKWTEIVFPLRHHNNSPLSPTLHTPDQAHLAQLPLMLGPNRTLVLASSVPFAFLPQAIMWAPCDMGVMHSIDEGSFLG